MTRILIADDHQMVRQGLKRILAEEISGLEFGEAGNVQETLACLRQGKWTVLLLDVFMPGGGGLEVLRHVTAAQASPPVLVVSSAPEEQMAFRALRAGAAGYLNKQAAGEELVEAVKKVISGAKYVSERLAQRMATQLVRPAPVALHERLSERELQVLQMLVTGKSLKEISAELSLSPKTISTFHTRILEKLHVNSDVELVYYALEHHLCERAAAAEPAA